MANQVARPNGAGAIMAQSPLFDQLPDEWDDLTANVSVGFPIIGIKAGKWHYRYKGEDQIILDAQGKFPAGGIQVVLLKAQKELSRTFYDGGYVEGVNNPPACWSSHGVRPDDSVLNPVNPVCATCPNAAWGSGATPAAPKAQACQQRRRTVLIPYSSDLTNEGGGGPCLLSVPPGSLTNFVSYGNNLRDNRIHYAGVVTELSFSQDATIAFPKIEFNYVRPLTDEEAAVVIGMREHEAVDRILNSAMVPQETDAPATTATAPPPPPPPPVRTATPPPPPPMRTATTSAVKPPAPNPVAAAKAAAGVAAPTQAVRVGGFNVAPAATANAPIAAAMARPATPPPTTRKVAAPTPPPAEEQTEMELEPEPEDVEGSVPDEMTDKFADLMKAT